ncbi:MAG TPA: hypothetical protein VMZ53_09365 [Kofleriaceae bacterium]|nr:hypothetical protein [Kofleriaceae bacterium]
MARSYRFKPRYKALAISAMGVGGTLGVVSAIALGAAALPLATGALGIALGGGYLLSPSWKLEVVVDDDALIVRSPKAEKFRIAWLEVKRVVASPSTKTCFVDVKDPARNFLVPGDGAPAPYDIEDREELYAAILAKVPREKIEEVETIEAAKKASLAKPAAKADAKPDA